jgi:hypothetical protein
MYIKSMENFPLFLTAGKGKAKESLEMHGQLLSLMQ